MLLNIWQIRVSMKRDDEINRLMKYAQGLGLSVRFKPFVKGGDAAEWTIDGTELTIYVKSKCSKLEKVLSLIHELGHQKAFIDNKRQFDPKIEEAIDSEENKKIHRKRLLDWEVDSSVYWEDIYRDTNCQFPMHILKRQMDFDIWQYEVHYKTGKFPKGKEKNKKWKELKEKYKNG